MRGLHEEPSWAWACAQCRKLLSSLSLLLIGSKRTPLVRGLGCHQEISCQGPQQASATS